MITSYYTHWRDVSENAWRWKNFSPAEIACRGSGSLRINEEALDKLQALRDRLAKPLIVRSAYRSPAHNQAVGGAPRSKHLDGAAFDIAMTLKPSALNTSLYKRLWTGMSSTRRTKPWALAAITAP